MSDKRGYAFGTFKGVFTPSILTILGVIMYLRLGWVLGQMGLPRTLLIVTMACAITFLTGLSLSALATNMRVAGGGAYFIISRSFGTEAGAAIGVPLFLAQAIGIAFYVAGFAESVGAAVPGVDPQTVGLATLCVLALITWFSADMALRTQYIILALILTSLVSFFLGGPIQAEVEPGVGTIIQLPFWAVFAVFFPAVTGIEAGMAMSGDLRNPARSLPRGTLLACAVGFMVYIAIPVVLSRRVADTELLVADPLIMRESARWGAWVMAGIWGASLSSAVGALLGAPRTLQALARDGAAPRFLSRGFGRGNDPRWAATVCFAIAFMGILAGGINVIAPVLSMFFLTSYASLNLAASVETMMKSVHWRPTFRVHWSLSLAGFLGCAAAMLMINAGAAILALVFCALVFGIMKRRRVRARWGDMRRALWGWMARVSLFRLDQLPVDERSWTPNLLVFSGLPTKRWHLIELADALVAGRGFMTAALVLPASIEPDRRTTARRTVRDYLDRNGVLAFVKTVTAERILDGAQSMVDGYGFGSLKPNTVVLGDTARTESVEQYMAFLRRLQRQHRNIIIVRDEAEEPAEDQAPDTATKSQGDLSGGYIDVWWEGKGPNAWFMLAIAYSLSCAEGWARCPLRLNTVVRSEEERREAAERLAGRIREARIEAEGRVLIASADVFHTVRDSSRESRICLLGLRPCGSEETPEAYAEYYESLMNRSAGLPLTAFVLASENMEFSRIFE